LDVSLTRAFFCGHERTIPSTINGFLNRMETYPFRKADLRMLSAGIKLGGVQNFSIKE
jgi:hypothetical protein